MAIYHFSAKLISRGAGRSAVAAAAYRAAARLHDERLGRNHDFTNKAGVVHSEVMLPEGAPERLRTRETLWNEAEANEKRKDAQLAREVEFAIPRELTKKQGVALAREFVEAEFVARGMIADLNVHWDIGPDGEAKPHAHVMLTLREISPEAFGLKCRDWNETALLSQWREHWAAQVNARCAELGIEARVDHRSYEAQGIVLEPQHKIGAAGARRDLRGEDAERADDHRAIARRNGAAIIAEPALGLEAITRGQATFTLRDLAKFAHRNSDGQEQFDSVLASMRGHESLLALGHDDRGHERLTTASMLSAEQALAGSAQRLAVTTHKVIRADVGRAITEAKHRGRELGPEQKAALHYVTKPAGLSLVVGYAGSGKSLMLGLAREAWEAAGYNVRGAALSGIAAENLGHGSGIASRTFASLEHAWARDRDLLSHRDILVIDEAGMIGTRQLQRVLAAAEQAGAKLVLVGDVQQLQAIEAGAAFRLLAERHGAAEITEVRRQKAGWMRAATRQFATGQTTEAVAAYSNAGLVRCAPTRAAARDALIEQWNSERRGDPAASRIILTHTNAEARSLNDAARAKLAEGNEIGAEVAVQTERGMRRFATNDRILFLRNERELGVKNGTLGTIERATTDSLGVRLDDGRRVAVDLKSYTYVDHGYAATVHKAQGMTVDRSYVLATPGLDAHGAYVALSRHRSSTSLHYGRDEFADEAALARTLSRERPKDMAIDYGNTRGPPENRGSSDNSRAKALRSMVANRVKTPVPTADSIRAAISRAARSVASTVRKRDRGAEL